MIKNRLIAIILLIVLISGTLLYVINQSPLGPVLTIAGIVGFFAFNRKE